MYTYSATAICNLNVVVTIRLNEHALFIQCIVVSCFAFLQTELIVYPLHSTFFLWQVADISAYKLCAVMLIGGVTANVRIYLLDKCSK